MSVIKPMRKVFGIAASVLFLAACTDPTTKIENHSIEVSDAAVMFNCTKNQPLQLTVVANPTDWEAQTEDSWLHLSEQTANTILLTADDNTGDSERNGEVVFTAGEAQYTVNVKQMPADGKFARYRQLLMFQLGAVMSPEGKYMGGFYATFAEDSSIEYHPVIIDLATDEWNILGPYPGSLAALYNPAAITDDGVVIFDTEAGGPMAFSLDGSNFRITTPDGFGGTPNVSSTSSDGKWVGYAPRYKDGEMMYYPILWEDGVGKGLPMPETSYRGLNYVDDAVALNGVMARSISANGEIITGTTHDNMDYGMVYWDRNGDVHYVGKDFRKLKPVKMIDGDGNEYDYTLVDGIICWSGQTQVSPNGKWIAGTFRGEELNAQATEVVETYHAAFYNTETEKVYVIEDYGESIGKGVTDDGKGLIGLGRPCVNGVVIDIESGMELGQTKDWIMDQFGIVVPEGWIDYIAPDGKAVMGVSVVAGGAQGVEECTWYVASALEE